MKRLAALAFLLISPPSIAAVPSPVVQAVEANWIVDRGCSGTLLDKDKGLFLTAYHCIQSSYIVVEKDDIKSDGTVDHKKVRVSVPGRVWKMNYRAMLEVSEKALVYSIEKSDWRLDLALLKTDPVPNGVAVKVACQPAQLGSDVYAVGNPYGILDSTLTAGTVSSVTRSYRDLHIAGDLGDVTDPGDHGLVQHTATIAPGNSGGALLNANGELVGVNVRGLAGVVAFAVPLQDVREFLGDVIPKCK